jgi:hypothetical protein
MIAYMRAYTYSSHNIRAFTQEAMASALKEGALDASASSDQMGTRSESLRVLKLAPVREAQQAYYVKYINLHNVLTVSEAEEGHVVSRTRPAVSLTNPHCMFH